MPVLLSCQSLTKFVSHRTLFEGITINLSDDERMALIGPNGTGKSTLLKILAGMEESDGGTITRQRGLRVGYLAQEFIFDPTHTPQQILLEAIAEDPMDEVTRSHRVELMFEKIGLAEEDQNVQFGTLSGGWRKRVAIARELIREPGLLLLDEPTNHLDLDGVLWLEKILRDATFAYLVISHDRYFLENSARRVVELSRAYPGGYFSAAGNYSEFIGHRETFLEGQMQTQRALESKVRREVEWLRKGPPARTTKSQARIDEAHRLIGELSETRTRNSQTAQVAVDFTASNRQANKLLLAKNVSKGYGGDPVIRDLNLLVAPGMKLGLMGSNGSGKSTLLKLLSGELEPDTGEIQRAEKLRVAIFDQNRDQLDPEESLMRSLCPHGETVLFRDQKIHVSGWARRFLFQTEQLPMPVKNLSGGEQARILIARMMLKPADLLLLDEPTNDLDIPSLEVLEESLSDFPGAIVLVSHDRYLLQRLSTDIVSLDGSGDVELFADYTQWENARKKAAKAAAKETKEPRKGAPEKPAEESNGGKASKRLSYKEQREFDQMEENIRKAEAELEQIHKDLEDPAIGIDPKRLQERCSAMAMVQEKIDVLFARWAELEEKQK